MPFAKLSAIISTISIQFLSSTTTSSSVSNTDVSGAATVVDSTSKLAEAISKYGSYAVILAIFIILFVMMILYINGTNKRMLSQIMKEKETNAKSEEEKDKKLLDAVLNIINSKTSSNLSQNPANIEYSGSEREKKANKSIDDYEGNKSVLVHAYVDINLAFKDAARIAIEKLKADRIAIYVFHNGNNSIHGFPFFKMSCIYEWSLHGTTQRGRVHADMPLYIYNNIIDALYNSDEYVVSDVKARLEEDDKCIEYFVEGGKMCSLFFEPIRDNDNELAGFTVSEFREINDFSNKEVFDHTKGIMMDFVSNIRSIVIHRSIKDCCEEEINN